MSVMSERCVECGEEIVTLGDIPLCSQDCRMQYAHRMIRNMSDDGAWCPTCGESFNDVKNVCYHHNNQHSFEVHRTNICSNCSETFRPSSSTNDKKYCSEQCFGEAKRKDRLTKKCVACEEQFQTIREDSRFCSESCYLETEHNPFWKDDSSVDGIRKSKEYRQWRQAIHNKYESCNKCGATENLHAHHIIPVSKDEELVTDVENGVLLCGACHSEEHPDMPAKLFIGEPQ